MSNWKALALCVCGAGIVTVSVVSGQQNRAVASTLTALDYIQIQQLVAEGQYALLTGAILGFAGLTVVMFATLRVDWGGHNQPTPASA